ncbi:MAG: flagellar assembly protein FliW [Desulfobulbaceae bacterium]|nr:flagellar assembly protein FliW [Desulfobulbaceae bacterium]HIJ78455.1 flagellar assembly protein FliW [Deltaproteobacteria bacterium]
MAPATANTKIEDQEMLTVSTSRFGELTVSPDKVIHMTSPFLGFPDSKNFMLKPHGKESPFMWLQSLETPTLAFVVIQAAIIAQEYAPHIPNYVKQELKASKDDQLEILLILTVPKNDLKKITANLLGPLVINTKQRLAKQVLQDPTIYDACWPIFK